MPSITMTPCRMYKSCLNKVYDLVGQPSYIWNESQEPSST